MKFAGSRKQKVHQTGVSLQAFSASFLGGKRIRGMSHVAKGFHQFIFYFATERLILVTLSRGILLRDRLIVCVSAMSSSRMLSLRTGGILAYIISFTSYRMTFPSRKTHCSATSASYLLSFQERATAQTKLTLITATLVLPRMVLSSLTK